MLFASYNEDLFVGRYAYTEFRGKFPQGTCDVGKEFIISRIQLDLNKDKTVIKSFTENHNQNPMDIFPSTNTKRISGEWSVKNDTLNIILKRGEEKYLIRDDNLIQLLRQKDGSYMQADSSKAYRGESRVFKRE